MEPEYKEIFTKKFPMPSIKTLVDLIALLERVGFAIEVNEDYTKLWSERTWENAEALHRRF